MKERPILFSTPMVKAVLNGTKTQTRRVVKNATIKENEDGTFNYEYKRGYGQNVSKDELNSAFFGVSGICPYGKVGDELWVRETFFPTTAGYSLFKADAEGDQLYLGTGDDGPVYAPVSDYRWKPSIFMPRIASRIQLRITDIRVERLQDISEEDAKAEGIEFGRPSQICSIAYKDYIQYPNDPFEWFTSPIHSFESLWDSINGEPRKDGVDISWSANPWVWVVEFEQINK